MKTSSGINLSQRLYQYPLSRSREIQIDDYKKDLEQLKQAQNNMIDTNYQLNDDLKNLMNQIELINEQNLKVNEPNHLLCDNKIE